MWQISNHENGACESGVGGEGGGGIADGGIFGVAESSEHTGADAGADQGDRGGDGVSAEPVCVGADEAGAASAAGGGAADDRVRDVASGQGRVAGPDRKSVV